MSEHPPSNHEPSAIPPDLLALQEWLAQRAHENWARQRLAHGWRYGPQRDDARKEHPSLVPYEDLPETEKAYDRLISLGTLEALLARGYRIELPPAAAADDADRSTEVGPPDQPTVDWFCSTAERLLAAGQPLDAYDVAETGLQAWPRHLRLLQLQAMALTRSGARGRALQTLEVLQQDGHLDAETMGALARLHKDSGLDLTLANAVRRDHLLQAEALYADMFSGLSSTWGGINAATLRVLLGDRGGARALSKRVAEEARAQLEQSAARGSDTYWLLATLGEAALILGKPSEAADWYGRAATVADGRYADIASTRRNARVLLDILPEQCAAVETLLRVPTVATIDVGTAVRRVALRAPLPNAIEESLRQHFRRALTENECRIAYLAPATSADVVFLETVAETGGETHIVLSEPKDRFVAAFLEDSSNAGWRARCEAILRQARYVLDSGEQRAGSVSAYAQRLMHGLAGLHAARLDTRVVSIGLGEPAVVAGASVPADQPADDETVVAILFADVPRFTRLSEAQLPSFVEHLLGNVRRVATAYADAILSRNTWGDGLYFVFSGVSDAGRFALDLSDRLALIDWPGHGLPADLGLRIALHAGPAYRFVDPVTGAITYTGPHVSRAARLEPITPPRHVYTSEAFAALAATDAAELRCDYVGRTSMAKGYGVFRTYHLRRSGTT